MIKIKSIILLILVSIVAAVSCSCRSEQSYTVYTENGVKRVVNSKRGGKEASKKIITREFHLSSDVSRISSYVSADIEYRIGQPKIEVTGREVDIENLEISNKGVNLLIGYRRSSEMEKMKIVITMQNLMSVNLYHAGDFYAKKIASTSVNINMLGAGDLKVGEVQATGLEVNMAGAGDFTCDKVSCTYFQLLSKGSGDVNISSIDCTSYRGILEGVGDINIGKIDVTGLESALFGTGDLRYKGISATHVFIRLAGTGDIELAGECTTAELQVTGVGDINARKFKPAHLNEFTTGQGSINF